MIKENVTEFKAENCIYIEDADNAIKEDAVEAPEAVPNSDPEEHDVGVVEDNQEAVLDSNR